MALDFPAAPTNGQEFSGYLWNGYAWDVKPADAAGTPVDAYTKAESDTKFVDVAGDTMTSDLIITKDGGGLTIGGGAKFFKKSGAGLIIYESSGGQQPRFANNDGSSERDIIDTTNGDARYALIVTNRANSAFMLLSDFALTSSYVSKYNTPFNYPNGNRRIKVTVLARVIPAAGMHLIIRCFGQEVALSKIAAVTGHVGCSFVQNGAAGTSTAVNVEFKSDVGSGSVSGNGTSWILVEDMGPR